MSCIEIKEWDTLSLTCEYKNDEGVPIDLSDICIGSELRKYYGGEPVTLDVAISNASDGVFVLTKPDVRLSPSIYKIDILFKDKLDDSILSSDTFELKVLPSITNTEAFVCPF